MLFRRATMSCLLISVFQLIYVSFVWDPMVPFASDHVFSGIKHI